MVENQEQDRKQEVARIRARGDACHARRLRDKRGRVSKRRLHRLESRVIRGETFDDSLPAGRVSTALTMIPFFFSSSFVHIHPSLARDRDRVNNDRGFSCLGSFLFDRSFSNEFFLLSFFRFPFDFEILNFFVFLFPLFNIFHFFSSHRYEIKVSWQIGWRAKENRTNFSFSHKLKVDKSWAETFFLSLFLYYVAIFFSLLM